MVAVTICSDFGAQKIKSNTVSTVSPSLVSYCCVAHYPKTQRLKTTIYSQYFWSAGLSWVILIFHVILAGVAYVAVFTRSSTETALTW